MVYHIPVLLKETIDCLHVSPGLTYLDGTLGHGGHTIEILKLGGTVYGLDADPVNLQISTQRISNLGLSANFHPLLSNFVDLTKIYTQHIKHPLNGMVFDLGLSNSQQKSDDRGFSFNDQSSLDMRLNPKTQKITAENIINTADFQELFDIFTKLGQEKFSKPLILRIIHQRQKSPIKTANKLADIIREYYTEHHIKIRHDPATQIFLALRIYINSELNNLKTILPITNKLLAPTGIACFITFHSGEDRLVKIFIQQNRSHLKPFKRIKPSLDEISNNPLSRSATLRAFQHVN